MPERQEHGFLYQEKKRIELDLIKEENYTAEFDAYRKNDNFPYQIKTIKFGSAIDLGDYFRNSSRTQDFILIIGFWKGTKDSIVETYILKIDYIKWNSLCCFDKKIEMRDEMKNISNNHSDDEKWKLFRTKYKKEYGNKKISLRFKRDHKEQKRIQCAINNFDFFNYFIGEFDGEKTTT